MKTGDLFYLDCTGSFDSKVHGWKPGSTGGPHYYFPNKSLGVFVRSYQPNPNMIEAVVDGVMCVDARQLVRALKSSSTGT